MSSLRALPLESCVISKWPTTHVLLCRASEELIGALLCALEKLHQRLERRRWTFRRIQVMRHMLGVAHPGQRDVDSRRRTHELKRALCVRLESLERLRQNRRQSLREPPLEQRRAGAYRHARSIRDRERVPFCTVRQLLVREGERLRHRKIVRQLNHAKPVLLAAYLFRDFHHVDK